MKRILPVLVVLLLSLTAPSQALSAPTKVSVKGASGQTLTVSRATGINPKGQWVTVTGRNFDERIGIYVTYCKVVPAGQVPTPCGAGIDMTGSTHTSVWISSNAPLLVRPLVTEYSPGGKFSVKIKIKAKTSAINCLKYKCAIVSKSDHLNLDSKKNDVVIPIKFKKGTK